MKRRFSLLLPILLTACLSNIKQEETPLKAAIGKISIPRPTQRITDFGVVSAAHPLAIAAGEKMLKEGGNAIDASVAASFAISVVKPQSTGIGGGGFLLYYENNNSNVKVYDFRERAPIAATRDMFLNEQGKPKSFHYKGKDIPDASLNGHLSVGVPGLVAGLVETHALYGKLPLPIVMQPAIDLAEQGFAIDAELVEDLKKRESILRSFPSSEKIFFPDGQMLNENELLIQKDLANTLRLISEKGKDGFYKGEVAEKIFAEMKDGRGLINEEDFNTYKVIKRIPVTGSYRGHKIVSMPPPSSGGTHILEILNILENDDIHSLGHNSVPYIHLLSEAMKRAYADRAFYLGDPDFVQIPTHALIAKDYGKKLRKTISANKATPSKELSHGVAATTESPSTTHISVIDKDGNAVSTTQTINYTFGSGVVAEGTGVLLNDEMDDFAIAPQTPNVFGLLGGEKNAVAARKTMLSSMSPTFVFSPSGKLKLIVGSPGGARIITATLQTILNVLDFQMPLYDAVYSPRIHHQWYPDYIRTETNTLSDLAVKDLEKMGHKVKEQTEFIGNVQAILYEDGRWVGVSDSR